MGIQHEAVIGVGLPAKELCSDHDEFEEKYGDQCDVLELVPPWYDADYRYCQAGVIVYQIEDGSLDIDLVYLEDGIKVAMDEFKEITGQSGKLFLSTYGY